MMIRLQLWTATLTPKKFAFILCESTRWCGRTAEITSMIFRFDNDSNAAVDNGIAPKQFEFVLRKSIRRFDRTIG